MYVINRGLALYGARVLTAGKVWGDDVILLSDQLRSRFCARAMNYLETYTIDRDTLFEIAENYPKSRRAIRRQALLLALKRRMALNIPIADGILPGDSSFMLRRKRSVRNLGIRQLGTKSLFDGHSATPVTGEPGPEPLKPILPLSECEKPDLDGATENDDSGSNSGDSFAPPSLSASMLRVESTLAALTKALGKVQAQQQASAERTESGMAALAARIEEIQKVQQAGSPGRSMATISSPLGVQQAAGLLLAPVARQRRTRGTPKSNPASTTAPYSEPGTKVEPSSPRTFSS